VTIDPDTEHLLREEARRSGLSFKKVLNESIRKALNPASGKKVSIEPLFDHPFPSEWEGVSMNRVADLLDDEEALRELDR